MITQQVMVLVVQACSRVTLVNSKNHKGEVFTLYKLRGIVSNNRVRHPSEIAEIIKKEYENFMGIASPASDIIVIVFKIM